MVTRLSSKQFPSHLDRPFIRFITFSLPPFPVRPVLYAFFAQNNSVDICSLFYQNWNAQAAAVIRWVSHLEHHHAEQRDITEQRTSPEHEDEWTDEMTRAKVLSFPESFISFHFHNIFFVTISGWRWVDVGGLEKWHRVSPTPFLFCINHLEYQLNVNPLTADLQH
jgi:hypothetical protein